MCWYSFVKIDLIKRISVLNKVNQIIPLYCLKKRKQLFYCHEFKILSIFNKIYQLSRVKRYREREGIRWFLTTRDCPLQKRVCNFLRNELFLKNMGDLKRRGRILTMQLISKNKISFAIKYIYLGLKKIGDIIFREQNVRILTILMM